MTSEQIEKAINAYIGHEPEIDEGFGTEERREAFKAGVYWLTEYLCNIPMKDIFFELKTLKDTGDEQKDN